MDIINYKILRHSQPETLSEKVMEHLREGWELFGQTFAVYGMVKNSNYYCQTVILRPNKPAYTEDEWWIGILEDLGKVQVKASE